MAGRKSRSAKNKRARKRAEAEYRSAKNARDKKNRKVTEPIQGDADAEER